MPLDPQISLSAGNYLTQNGQKSWTQDPSQLNALVGTANALQTLQAKQAIGQAYQQATDPTTGQTNFNKLTGIISQNPKAAIGMPDVVTQAIAQAHGNLVNQGYTADLATKHMDVLGQSLAPLLGKVDPVTGQSTLSYGDLVDAAGLLMNRPESDRSVDTPQVIKYLTAQPRDDSPASAKIRMDNLKQLELQRSGISDLLKQIYPTAQGVDQGNATRFVQNSGITGVNDAPGNASTIRTNMSPGQAAMPVTGAPAAGGAPTTMPLGNYGRQFGIPGSTPGSGAPAAAGGLPTTGRYPAPQAQAPAPGAMPQGSMVTGLPPGQAEGETAFGHNAGQSFAQAVDAAGNYADRVYPLNQLLTKLQSLGKTGTGPGTAERNQVVSFLQSVPGVGDLLGIDPKNVADFDEANKYATQYAQRRADAFGPRTNENLSTALTANPSTHISNLGATDVTKANIALERMKQAQTLSAIDSNVGAKQYPSYAAKWNTDNDPRAFAIDLASDPSKVIAGLKPEEKAKFVKSYRAAVKYGLVAPPQGLGNAAAQP